MQSIIERTIYAVRLFAESLVISRWLNFHYFASLSSFVKLKTMKMNLLHTLCVLGCIRLEILGIVE